MMLFFNGKVSVPMDKIKGEFYSFKPGVMLNMSKFGICSLHRYHIYGETLTLNNDDKITFGKIGYGLQAVVKF